MSEGLGRVVGHHRDVLRSTPSLFCFRRDFAKLVLVQVSGDHGSPFGKATTPFPPGAAQTSRTRADSGMSAVEANQLRRLILHLPKPFLVPEQVLHTPWIFGKHRPTLENRVGSGDGEARPLRRSVRQQLRRASSWTCWLEPQPWPVRCQPKPSSAPARFAEGAEPNALREPFSPWMALLNGKPLRAVLGERSLLEACKLP